MNRDETNSIESQTDVFSWLEHVYNSEVWHSKAVDITLVVAAGIQRHAMHEPSFVNPSAGFRSKGQMAGDFIVKGADGRGGRTTVLRPSNKPPQVVPMSLHTTEQICPAGHHSMSAF